MNLKDYQKEAIKFLIFRRRAILQMGCGMGKTATALYACPYNKEVVVVGPPSLRDNWINEAMKTGRTIKFISSFDKKSQRDCRPPHSLIIDEAHAYLSNFNQNFHLIKLALKSKRLYMLTATPLINNPLPLYWMLKLCGENWTKHDFLFKFCGGKRRRDNPYIVYPTGPTNLDILRDVKRKYTFFKNRKLKIKKISIDLGKAPIKTAGKIEDYSNIENILGILKSNDANVLSFLKKMLTNYKKCVIFFNHKEVGIRLHKICGGVLVDGDVSFKKRNEIFKNLKGSLFLNSRAVGVGVNIEDADCVIFVERTWSPFKDYQAYMRCYRMERKEVLKVYFLDYEDEAKLLVGKRKNILKEV